MSDEKAIWIWAALVLATGLAILVVSSIFGPRRVRAAKMDSYECGVPLFQDARERFPVRFYLMAVAFILFDIEVVFLLPWAVLYRRLQGEGLLDVLVFTAVLGIGYLYIWKRGVIDWE